MYKAKVAVLYTNSQDACLWNYGWIDWDGLDNEDLHGMAKAYGKSEEKNLQEIVDDTIKVLHSIVVETFDITEGRYLCDGCGYYFDKEQEDCRYCGCSVIIDTNGIDEPDTPKKCFNHCPKCNATDPDIEWGDYEWGSKQAWQDATCKKCGQEFSEVYKYSTTEKKHNR